MTAFLDEVADQLNLRWAWEKVRRQATPGDAWFDEVELAGFELNLQRNLESIKAEFTNGQYTLTPLRPLPFPKRGDEQEVLKLRQTFQVAVRDQVAWVAVVNVVGPHVDSQMPPWSYGNRLYRSIWVEPDKGGVKRRRIGRYRHAAGHLYLPFNQGWPIFRRHVYLATRAMTKGDRLPEMDEQTREEEALQQRLAEEYRCPFVMKEYWLNRRTKGTTRELYWCGLDLEKFYPRLRVAVIRDNIVEQLPATWRDAATRLLDSMLSFRLDMSGWAKNDLEAMSLRPGGRVFRHIPTGLYVAGFLANAALLKVDLQVTEKLKKHRIAHFRYVDDHIVLAYTFAELRGWVREYEDLLKDSRTGARFNLEKVKPAEFARILAPRISRWSSKRHETAQRHAEIACRLDPQFPSPLMTKTLALVSAIARTDFNLLESHELQGLTDQLEHLLLVDLPDEEIQEQTRIAFAATRLARIVECRLAAPESLAGTRPQPEVERVFQLLRKALRERPDRVRLWTCAVRTCRLTGAGPLAHLLADIRGKRDRNPLASEYLYANVLCLLASQALEAVRVFRSDGVADWRKQAARAFLKDLGATPFEEPGETRDHWYLHMSWSLYCFGVYCADLVFQGDSRFVSTSREISLPERLCAIGKQYVEKGGFGHTAAQLAWWAARATLRDLQPHADGFVKAIGEALEPSLDTTAFWRFFPLDVPTPALRAMTREQGGAADRGVPWGWWYDALRSNCGIGDADVTQDPGSPPARVRQLLANHDPESVSLYEWCDHVLRLSKEASERGTMDPRSGEWTALEIVRQIASKIGEEPIVGAYLRSETVNAGELVCVHPANFRIPREWVLNEVPTWRDWQQRVQNRRPILYVPEPERIFDERYTPLSPMHSLFRAVDPVRGLGLLLYGLLRRSFDLPAAWNGPGHASVLAMLPRLLLADMTCSSWTLGVLQGCLLPRATENLFLKRQSAAPSGPDDDRLRDPVELLNASDVQRALRVCQEKLREHQLSTLRESARQLTPVSIRQLTEPEWAKDFEPSTTADDETHD